MKIRNQFIIVVLIAIVFCVIFAVYALDRGSEDDGNNVSFVIDEDDVNICQAEKFERAAMSSYDARVDLFMKKALSNDDRDGDGVSTLDNCSGSFQTLWKASSNRCALAVLTSGPLTHRASPPPFFEIVSALESRKLGLLQRSYPLASSILMRLIVPLRSLMT